jgi:anti-sigma factor RsiW
MITCDRAQQWFGPAWDDEWSVAEREALEAHFAKCPPCQRAYDEYARTLELVQSLPRPVVADDFAERVLRTARARELDLAARSRRPALLAPFGGFGSFGGRIAVAAALAVAVGAGALALSRPHAGVKPGQPQVAAVPRSTEARPTTVALAPSVVSPTPAPVSASPQAVGHLASGDPDAPMADGPHVASARMPGRRTAGSALASAIPDSLFDHSADVDFVLDPVKMRRERGRGYTPVTNPVQGERASITF